MRLPALCALVSGALVAAAAKVSVDDTDPSIVYASPGEEWTRHVNQAARYELYNDSDTFTSVRGATITWKFRGTSVEYWGNTGPYHGPCSVTVNGVGYGNISSNAPQTGPPIALFQHQGLSDDSEHTIVIRVMAAAYPNVCELDRFVYEPVETKSTTSESRPSETPGAQSGSSSSKSSSRWAIIGGAIGGTIGAIILVLTLGACYCQRKRSKVAKDVDEAFKFPPGMPTLPVITPMSEPPSPFALRPISAGPPPPSVPSRPLSVGSSVYMGGVPPGLGGPIAAQRASAVYDGPPSGMLMPMPHPRRPVSVYGSESQYGSLPSPAASSMAGHPLLSRTSTHSSLSAPAGTRPLSPGRPQYVLSAASELGEPEAEVPAWPGDVKVKPKDAVANATVSPSTPAEPSSSSPAAAAASTSVPPTVPADVPVVQHTDAGTVTEPATAHTPEELPPAYNEQWSGGRP